MAEERPQRKTRTGFVVSTKMDKTVVVNTIQTVRHPLYSKIYKRNVKLYAHDEANDANVGDKVLISETRPMSKLKRWNADVPEIHISSDTRNPIIRMKISEVDYESIVEKARVEKLLSSYPPASASAKFSCRNVVFFWIPVPARRNSRIPPVLSTLCKRTTRCSPTTPPASNR